LTLDYPASDADKIARYIFERDWLRSNPIKHNVFMPNSKYPNEISVFLVTECSEESIWDIGSRIRTDKEVLARADLKVAEVQKIANGMGGFLQVLVDGVGHPKHANIKAVPSEKSLMRVVATELAEKAHFVKK
jgi:hypothetical protein